MIKINKKLPVSVIFIALIAASSVALAGDVNVLGNTSLYILDVQNTATDEWDRIAVYGKSTPLPYWGYGGHFEGGWKGVRGVANLPGGGTRFGVEGLASGGSSANYAFFGTAAGTNSYGGRFSSQYIGAYGEASSSTTATTYGVFGMASFGTNANLGVYGIAGGNNAYAGYFSGTVWAGKLVQGSDENLKEGIGDLDSGLEQVMQLQPKSFRYRTKEHPNMNLPSGNHFGLLAQDLREVLPDLVEEAPMPENSTDQATNQKNDQKPEDKPAPKIDTNPKKYLAANYVELIPVLIKAIQEQQAQIADLQYQVASLTGNKNK